MISIAKSTCLALASFVVAGLFLSPAAFAQSGELEKTFNMGTQSLQSGDLDSAATAFTRVIALQPGFAEAHFNLGLVRLQQGQYETAIPLFEKSIRLKPAFRGPHLFLGIVRYRTNDYADAIAAFKGELQLNPANPDALMWMGIVNLAQGDAKSASANLVKASALRPNDVDILYHMGRAYMLLSKDSYEQMFKADPKSWRVHQVLAQSFTEADRLEEAAAECLWAIKLKPAEPGLHEQLADIYWKQNKLENAETQFQKELEIDQRSTTALYKLAVVSLERAKPAIAADLLKKVLERSPGSAEAHYQLARAQEQLEQSGEAISNFSYVVSGSRQDDTEILRQSYYHLAQLYRRAQKPQESKQAMEAFLRLKEQADHLGQEKLQDKLSRSLSEEKP